MPLVSFFTPWKHQKTRGFLCLKQILKNESSFKVKPTSFLFFKTTKLQVYCYILVFKHLFIVNNQFTKIVSTDIVLVVFLLTLNRNLPIKINLITKPVPYYIHIYLSLILGIHPLKYKETALHKKRSFPLRISLVNLTKSAVSCGFRHIYYRNP